MLALAGSLRRWFSPADLHAMRDLLRDRPSGWIASGGGTIVGFLLDAPTVEAGVQEIAWMAVHESWQGHGVGSRLLEALGEALAGTAVHTLEVATVAASAGYAPYVIKLGWGEPR